MACSRGGADDSAGVVQRLIVHAVLGFFVAAYAVAMAYRPVHAQQEYIPRGQPIPENIRYVNATATGAQTTASVSWTSAMGHTSHHRLPVHVSAATLGRLANAAVRRGLPLVGWGLTFKGIVDAAGWAIDELTGQVMDPGTPLEPLGDFAFCTINAPTVRCASSPGLMTASAHLASPSNRMQPCVVAGFRADGGARYNCTRVSDGVMVFTVEEFRTAKPSSGWDGYLNENAYVPATVIPDAQVGDLIKSNPQVVNAVLIDPETGAPIRTQELTDALNALRTQLEIANGQAAGTDLVAATDYAESTPSQTEWPEFCGWANRLCDWLFEEEATEEHPDLPYVEVQPDNLDGFDSGFGSGGCPAPYVVGVLDGEFEIQWDGLCGFVDYLRPVVIAFSWLAAAFIVVQTVRSR